jgi:undecaprenyl diphosphate synthase
MNPNILANKERLPLHVGIIMDGNGRWAKKRGLPRSSGHREGVKAAKKVVKAASDIGIRYLTLFVFSTENWRRAQDEVSFLMHLINAHLKKELKFYRDNRIRVVHSGDPKDLPPDVNTSIADVVAATAHYEGLTVNLAINYGGRNEIVRAVQRWIEAKQSNGKNLSETPFTEQELSTHLDHPGMPEVDYVIRTSGEMRISNFMLWESAYAELYFSPDFWPDWNAEKLLKAIHVYQQRDRRFGCS